MLYNATNIEKIFDKKKTSGGLLSKKSKIYCVKLPENALKADKYEQVSIVRNGKNRVETYEKNTDKGIAKVSFIKNPGNIMVTLNVYAPRK